MKTLVPFVTVLSAVLLSSGQGRAATSDWPIFRGPNHDGISRETGWLTSWPADGPKKLWEKKNLGIGFSAVAVADGRVYTMGNVDKTTDIVYCLDAATGKELWKYSYACPLDAKYYEGGTHATPTVVDGRVYAVGKRGQVCCLEAASGRVLWMKNVAEVIGAELPTWGFASSVLPQGNLILVNLGAAGVALEAADGKVVWKSGATPSGYSTPVPCEFQGAKCVALALKDSVAAVRVADGKELWRHPWKTAYDIIAADPIVWGNQVFISSGYKKGCCLIDVGGTQPVTVWQNTLMRNHFSSCVRLGDYLYGMDGDAGDAGFLRCLEWKTGKEKWAEAVDGTGSLMAADGKLIVLTAKGELSVVAADPTGYKALAKATVLGGKCWTAPVLSGGRIYCRNAQGVLVCLDVKGK